MKKIFILVGVFVVIGIYYVYQNTRGSANDINNTLYNNESSETTESVSEQDRYVYIDVAGAVNIPGVITLPVDSIVNDAISEAGGFSSEYDKSYVDKNINLAEKVTDGQKIYVPYKGEVVVEQVNLNDVGSPNGGLVNINTASLSELDSLPSIGPVTAQAIIDGRPYKKIEELLEITGIGESTFDKIKEKIRI
ncbi:MAG TPA: helix-hairpin-helix domain-containing protein [Candidatus Dojkabacteria bacterium]|nr:helix-hairpin-helix domain-containing protein [Candidatus Dojkabacteria bacterium]